MQRNLTISVSIEEWLLLDRASARRDRPKKEIILEQLRPLFLQLAAEEQDDPKHRGENSHEDRPLPVPKDRLYFGLKRPPRRVDPDPDCPE